MSDLEVKYLWEPVAIAWSFCRIIFDFFLDTYLIRMYIIL